jgi:hypothetical protein
MQSALSKENVTVIRLAELVMQQKIYLIKDAGFKSDVLHLNIH